MDQAERNLAKREAPGHNTSGTPNRLPGVAAGSLAAQQAPRLPFPPTVLGMPKRGRASGNMFGSCNLRNAH